MSKIPLRRRSSDTSLWRGGQALLLLVGLLCVLSITFLVSQIIRDLRLLNSAQSDNVHWVLSQAEVELLEFRYAIETAKDGAGPEALESVVVEFDVFYGRIDMLNSGALYSELRQIEGFGKPIADILSGLDALIPLIDGPRSGLRLGLADLGTEADRIRPLLRAASTTGLQFFVERSDQSRDNFATTLLRLALIAAVLLFALIVLLGYNRRVGKKAQTREHELAEAYARINTILETSLDAVIVSDLNGRILDFNSAAERIFDHKAKDVIGRNIAEVIVPEHLRAAHNAGMDRMRASGEQRVVGHGRVQLEAKRRNGEIFPVELALEKARANGDEMVVAFLRDISHRIAAETELVVARDKALAGEKAKADFLAMMTHEIRTPLNGLLGNLALMEKTPLSAAQDRYVRNMDISGGLLMHHVDAVLDVARFEAGAMPSREDVVHLGRLVQDIVDSQAIAAEAQGNTIQWGWVGPAARWVRIDASRLQQVLVNLVGNAIKFTRHGAIVIEVEQTEINKATGSGTGLELRVIDTGIGISEADQTRVFNDFQTIEHADTNISPGTGLGLGIVRRFVNAMGGEIGLESSPGEGSVFWVRLPLTLAEGPDKPVATQAEPKPNIIGRDILLVEDNEINLELAAETLTTLGHLVTEARNGRQAVTLATAHRFDLILMDIRMPVMNGMEATQAIREGGGASHDVPIVALSANVLPEARDRFTKVGMSGFLPKPLNGDDLRSVIAQLTSDTAPLAKTVAPVQSAKIDALYQRYQSETAHLFDWLASAPLDVDKIAEQAHKVAGSAAAFGHPQLRDALVAVETAAEEGNRAALIVAIQKASTVWQDLRAPQDP